MARSVLTVFGFRIEVHPLSAVTADADPHQVKPAAVVEVFEHDGIKRGLTSPDLPRITVAFRARNVLMALLGSDKRRSGVRRALLVAAGVCYTSSGKLPEFSSLNEKSALQCLQHLSNLDLLCDDVKLWLQAPPGTAMMWTKPVQVVNFDQLGKGKLGIVSFQNGFFLQFGMFVCCG